jgi:hypothetical protein
MVVDSTRAEAEHTGMLGDTRKVLLLVGLPACACRRIRLFVLPCVSKNRRSIPLPRCPIALRVDNDRSMRGVLRVLRPLDIGRAERRRPSRFRRSRRPRLLHVDVATRIKGRPLLDRT